MKILPILLSAVVVWTGTLYSWGIQPHRVVYNSEGTEAEQDLIFAECLTTVTDKTGKGTTYWMRCHNSHEDETYRAALIDLLKSKK